jgi:hypothetical protein
MKDFWSKRHNDLRKLPFGQAGVIIDAEKESLLYDFINQVNSTNWLKQPNAIQEFCDTYRNWLTNSKLNNLKGLDSFPYANYSLGTTETFDKFHLKYHNKRFRCFRGEYAHHKIVFDNHFPNWKYIESEELKQGDAVVVSMPFSETGDIHKYFTTEFLDECYLKNIPVLIDSAIYGTVGGIEFDYSHPAIEQVTFSLSKVFPTAFLRVGIRFTRVDQKDMLSMYHNVPYTGIFGALVGKLFMEKYSCDEVYEKNRVKQIEFCNQLNVTPSKSVLFGIDHNHEYNHYSRGADTNRLCFNKYYIVGTIPKDSNLV